MRRSRVAFALGVVVPLLVLGGCSDDDPEPRIAPTTSTSPSDTGSPSPTSTGPVEPTMPASAKKQTAAGAKAFIRYFWDVANYSQVSGDVSAVEQLSTESCVGCRGAVKFVRGVFARGGTISGGEASVSDLSTEKLTAAGKTFFRVTFTVSNTRQIVDEPGTKRDKVFRAASVTDRFVLNLIDGEWRVGVWEVLV